MTCITNKKPYNTTAEAEAEKVMKKWENSLFYVCPHCKKLHRTTHEVGVRSTIVSPLRNAAIRATFSSFKGCSKAATIVKDEEESCTLTCRYTLRTDKGAVNYFYEYNYKDDRVKIIDKTLERPAKPEKKKVTSRIKQYADWAVKQ